jgi:CRP-like cAMP-binding protein
MAVIRVLSLRLREADDQVRGLLFDRVESRVRRLLLRLAQDPASGEPPRRVTPPLTHQSLAEQAGTSRETITRVIKQLKDEGWLGQTGKRYVVPEEPK